MNVLKGEYLCLRKIFINVNKLLAVLLLPYILFMKRPKLPMPMYDRIVRTSMLIGIFSIGDGQPHFFVLFVQCNVLS